MDWGWLYPGVITGGLCVLEQVTRLTELLHSYLLHDAARSGVDMLGCLCKIHSPPASSLTEWLICLGFGHPCVQRSLDSFSALGGNINYMNPVKAILVTLRATDRGLDMPRSHAMHPRSSFWELALLFKMHLVLPLPSSGLRRSEHLLSSWNHKLISLPWCCEGRAEGIKEPGSLMASLSRWITHS